MPPSESPTAGDPRPDAADERGGEEAGETAGETTARRALWPWVARPSKVQIVALAVISCLALGPLAALAVVLRADTTAVDVLAEAPARGEDVSQLTVTALGLTPSAGELRVRVVLQPPADLLGAGGRLVEPVTVGVNDARGTTTHTFEADQPPAPFEVSLPLLEGTVTRYPFDRYEAPLLVAVTADAGGRQEPVPVVIEARSAVDDFVIGIASPAGDGPEAIAGLEWKATRPATTTVYAVWLMVLMWGLAVTGLLIVWAVVIWRVDLQFWVFGYFVGVLFALPPLRESLPGRPPPGTLFDFLSFYWSVTIVGVTLMLLLVIWLRRARAEAQLRSIDEARLREHP